MSLGQVDDPVQNVNAALVGREFKPLPRKFFAAHTLEVAPALLGHFLVRQLNAARLIGRIVEVEAYRGADDPASHAYRGRTARNAVMWGAPGSAYVYFTYGNHYCLNVVTEPEGEPAAVLLRAVEPIDGQPWMKRFRGAKDVRLLASGPGRLTQAFRITGEHNGTDLTRGDELYVAGNPDRGAPCIAQSTRVGIRVGVDKPWRFYLANNAFVSRP